MELSNIVSATVSSFIEYALFIVTIMIIWYIIKFFMAAPPTKEEKEAALQAQREAWGGAIKKGKEKYEERKKEGEKKKEARIRKSLLQPAKGFAIRTEEAAEKLRDDELNVKTVSAVASAQTQVDKIKSNLSDLKKTLRAARHQEKGDKREYIQNLYDYNEAIINHFNEHIKENIPPFSLPDVDWKKNVREIKNHANQIRGELGVLITNIDKFIDEGTLEKLSLSSSGRGGGSI